MYGGNLSTTATSATSGHVVIVRVRDYDCTYYVAGCYYACNDYIAPSVVPYEPPARTRRGQTYFLKELTDSDIFFEAYRPPRERADPTRPVLPTKASRARAWPAALRSFSG